MAYKVATGPATEPVSLAEAKAQLRVEHNDEDTLILSLISAARRKLEQETGRALLSQTITEYWDEWPTDGIFELSIYPVTAVTSFQYIDTDGATNAWPSDNYHTSFTGMSVRIWTDPEIDAPDLGDYPDAVQISYTAGESAVTDVPPELKHAILTTVALLYERREDMPLGNGVRTAQWLQFGSRKHLI
jgi:uncharacterized phiE125 gp8 family phage protein